MTSTTMSAVVLTGHGGLDKLVYREDVPVPQPERGEVQVRVMACSVNNTDINTRVAWYGRSVSGGITKEIVAHGLKADSVQSASWNDDALRFPRIQGAAAAGIITAVGEGVCASRVGERVVIDPVIRSAGLPAGARGIEYVGSERDGGYANYLALPAGNAITVNKPVPYAILSTLPCAYQTAEEMQIRSQVSSDDIVVVTGAAGGVGLANVQLAKLRGAFVVAICAGAKAARVSDHGADIVIARDGVSPIEMLTSTLGARKPTVVLDVVGSGDVGKLWSVLDRGGRFATGGAIAGPHADIDLRDLIYKDLSIYGIANPEPTAMWNLVSYVEDGRLLPTIDSKYPLVSLREAQLAFAAKDHVGKIVIEIEDA